MISFLFVDAERVWRGGQDQLLTLLHGLILRGHQVNLVCYPGTLLEKRARAIGARVFPVAIRFQLGLLAMIRITRVLARCHPEVLAFNTPRPILVGSVASRFVPVRARIVFRRVNFPLRKSPITRFQYTWGIDCIVAISESIHGQLVAGGIPPPLIRTIYEGIDLSLYPRKTAPNPHREGGRIVVGTVAHLSPEKGLRFLVEAAALVPSARSRLQFVIVGDGQCRAELEDLVREKGLSECFTFAGFQDRTIQSTRTFDMFVLPSLSEGLSSAILTAMACSLPVIATNIGGIPELVSDGVNGLLVPPGDPVSLAGAIQQLIDDPEGAFRMGLQGRKRAEEHFTLQRKIVETEQLCYSLLGNAGKSSSESHA
jgi:glycosyltransferase involved in cell wall biosynthesis